MKALNQPISRFFLLMLVGLLIASPVRAQEDLPNRPFQLTFLYPLSTSGFNAGDYTHSFSVNVLAGYHGGVNGIEFGGLANVIRRDVNGAQFAGLTNVVGRDVHGIQAAGLLNINGGDVAGTQLAGLANVTGGTASGSQVAGLLNIAPKGIKGIQLSGILNVATNLKGLQVGLVNYADTVESGTPIGLISIVRRGGVKQLEVGYQDVGLASASLRLGSGRLYNIFSVGYRPFQEEFSWAVGYGLGTRLPLSNRLALNLELAAYHLNEGGRWNEGLSELYRANGLAEFRILDFLSVYGGVAWNVFLSDQRDENGNFRNPWADKTLTEQSYDKVGLWMRPGYQFGIRVGI